METVKDVFTEYKKQLSDVYKSNEIESLTLLALSELLDKSKAQLKAFPETTIHPDQQLRLQDILNQLATGKPLQYVIGHTEFYGLQFIVNPSVLIPRPETEELVEWVLETVKEQTLTSILDIGTGSGCIPISLKFNLIDADVHAIDISPEALAIAKDNARLNQVNVDFIQADILSQPKIGFKVDIIASNPPYVTPTDKEKMHHNVVDFEPHLALFVPQNDPLLFYDAISTFALTHLQSGGYLFFEINESYGKETVALLNAKGFESIELRQDMSGRDRMIKARLKL